MDMSGTEFITAVTGLQALSKMKAAWHAKVADADKDFIVNKTLLLDETNIKILNKKPSQYIEDMIEKHESEDEVKKMFAIFST